MKSIEYSIPDYKIGDLLPTLQSKYDYVKLLLNCARFILVESKIQETPSSLKMKLLISKMSRLFFFEEKRFFSISFPFNVVIDDNEVCSINTYSGREVNSYSISAVFAILNDDDFKRQMSPISHCFQTGDIDEVGLFLLEEIIQFEPSYLRYDDDDENSNGDLHPRHHIDVNYSNYSTFKIGLYSALTYSSFENLVDRTTACVYLMKNQLQSP